MKRTNTIKNRAARVVWDEENLGFWEANKTPKQKIDEPKTPYHPPGTDDNVLTPTAEQNAAHADAIRVALSQVASTSDSRRDDSEGSSSSSSHHWQQETMDEYDDHPPTVPGRRRSFEERRHEHQQEYRKAKTVLGQDPMAEDDDLYHLSSHSSGSCSTSRVDHQESSIRKGVSDIDIEDA